MKASSVLPKQESAADLWVRINEPICVPSDKDKCLEITFRQNRPSIKGNFELEDFEWDFLYTQNSTQIKDDGMGFVGGGSREGFGDGSNAKYRWPDSIKDVFHTVRQSICYNNRSHACNV